MLLQGPPQQTATFPRIMLLIMMPADFLSQLIFLPFVSNSNTLPFSQNFQEQFAVHSAQFVGEGMVEMSPEGEQNLSLSFKSGGKQKERVLSAKSPHFEIKCCLKFKANSQLFLLADSTGAQGRGQKEVRASWEVP